MSAQIIPIRERVDVTDWPVIEMALYAQANGWKNMRVVIEGSEPDTMRLWMVRTA